MQEETHFLASKFWFRQTRNPGGNYSLHGAENSVVVKSTILEFTCYFLPLDLGHVCIFLEVPPAVWSCQNGLNVMCNCTCDSCSPPGSSVRGISQARILEWAVISFSRGSSRPGIEPMSPALAGEFFITSTTWEAPFLLQHWLISLLCLLSLSTFPAFFSLLNYRQCDLFATTSLRWPHQGHGCSLASLLGLTS